MKFSDLRELISDYEQACYSPTRMAVHFGCDCGCGGNSYTTESWDAEEETARKSIGVMKEFCKDWKIEYDGVEE